MFDKESLDLLNGVKLFNEHDYFSAHDYFEAMWNESSTTDKLFFQGLVQISVGCFHAVCGNLKGAISQLGKGVLKLERFLPDFKDVDVLKLTEDVKLLNKEIDLLFVAASKNLDLNLLPKINIKKK